ncbi:hypothetical protein ACFWA9_15210 [Kitasatospora sp. NPDC059973]|uniref:hypothetical protein n=1 Tax=Kitasatospora sp. NPDC059973 TaxID=3347020 RepID=UPI0036933E81
MSDAVPPSPSLSVAELSSEAAELLSAAVRSGAPGGAPGLVLPGDAVEAVAALAGVTARLPELLDQLASFLSSEQAAGRVGPARGEGLDGERAHEALRAARDAREHLYEAARTAALVAEAVTAAATVLAPLGMAHPAGRPAEPHA